MPPTTNHSEPRANSSAQPAVEDRDFIRPIKGKTPKEVLGVLSQSSLGVAIAQATVFTLVLIGISFVPPVVNKIFAKQEAPEEKVEEKQGTETGDKNAVAKPDPAKPAPAKDPAKPAIDTTKLPAVDPDFPKKLGISETKGTQPKDSPPDPLDEIEKKKNK